MDTIKPFSLKSGHFIWCSKKGTRRDVEVNKATGRQNVKVMKWCGKQSRSYTLVCFSQKMWKNVLITNKYGEHIRKIEDGDNWLPAITKVIVGLYALHASKSRANVVVVLKDRHFDASYL